MDKIFLPSLILMAFVILVMFTEGCVQQIGGEKDEHGCLIPAGYSWCEEKQKCLRTWEENCTELIGGQEDEHGCLIAAGYSWCDEKQKCIRPWEENCSDYTITETTNESCSNDSECVTPGRYLMLSHCPYTSKCIEGKCVIICPFPFKPSNPEIESFEECTAAGYPVMESYPRQCKVPGGQTFIESPKITEQLCNSSRGHWNECSNRCQLDNQGKEGAACTLQCEQLCECGGIAGFGCPSGYICEITSSIVDALGYCVLQ